MLVMIQAQFNVEAENAEAAANDTAKLLDYHLPKGVSFDIDAYPVAIDSGYSILNLTGGGKK